MERPASLHESLLERVVILLAEDHPCDVRLTREALREEKDRNDLHVVPDGVEALAYLRGVGPYAGAARPDLVLLELNLPRLDGRAVLREVAGFWFTIVTVHTDVLLQKASVPVPGVS